MIPRIATSKRTMITTGPRSNQNIWRTLCFITLTAILISTLSYSTLAQTANVTVGVTTVPEESTGTITVTLTNGGTGLSDFQGKIIFDNSVVSVRDVIGLNGYTIAAFQIDNFQGEARFIGFKSSGSLIADGEFLQFTLEAVGIINDTSALDMQFISLNDASGSAIDHIVTSGRFTVGARSQLNASFSFSPAKPEINEPVQFSDSTSGGSEIFDTWMWDFGDGNSSNEQNPSHTYPDPGNYTVSLTVTDSVGTTNTSTQTVAVLPPGGADVLTVHNFPNPASTTTTFSYFVPADSTQALLSVFSFTGPLVFTRTLDLNSTQFQWDLRDSNGNDLPNGLYLYRVWASTPEGARLSTIGKLVIAR